jgi:RNA polymerase sigma-70 factor (ECF subfamily)
MKIRKDARNQLIPLPEDEENQTDFMELPDFLHLLDRQEEENSYKTLNNEIEKLNDGQKTCIKLFFIENKTYSEIFNLTGYDFRQVKSFIQNGKRNLKLKLQKLKEAT